MFVKSKILLFLFALISTVASASDYFTELRIGFHDDYKKSVQHQTQGTLDGNFKAINFGARFGKYFAQHGVYVEFNPAQDVEIKSANELAEVHSYFIGYRYKFDFNLFVGAQIGYSSFELIQGPNGVTFADNPTTSGFTYGLNLGYQYPIYQGFYAGLDVAYNFGSYSDDGPSVTPVREIEIEAQSQINLSLGYMF